MSDQHIVVVYKNASGALQVTPNPLTVKSGHSVMFFCEDYKIDVNFNSIDTPFDRTHTLFEVQAASYMPPEPVIEQPIDDLPHHYTISVEVGSERHLLKNVDPVIIVEAYPLEDKTKDVRSKPKNQK